MAALAAMVGSPTAYRGRRDRESSTWGEPQVIEDDVYGPLEAAERLFVQLACVGADGGRPAVSGEGAAVFVRPVPPRRGSRAGLASGAGSFDGN
jgi:hypothetical protein